MKSLFLLLSLLTPFVAQAKCGKAPVKIAVIDTGFGFKGRGKGVKLCQYGHKDFSTKKVYTNAFHTKIKVPLDTESHGTNVAGIIDALAKRSGVDYCIVIVKFYDTKNTEAENVIATEKAFEYAYNLKVDMVNYSAGGNSYRPMEELFVKKILDRGNLFVAAAGNESKNLDNKEFYFPAMYDSRVIAVGSTDRSGQHLASSNYGSVVKRWEPGLNVSVFGINKTGTSQATAIATGKLLKERFGEGNECSIKPQNP